MAYYLHCNACYFRPGMGVQRRFFITNCSHIYCESCVSTATKDVCKVCKSKCSILCLAGKIPKEVESMFLDPVESCQKFFKEFFQRLEFQRSHQKRLMRHMTEQTKTINNIIKQAQKLEREYLLLKSQNEYLMRIMPKNCNPRGGPRSGSSPGIFQASPSQTSSAFGKNQNFTSLQQKPSGGANIPPQPGRLLLRTPPSGGRLGSVGSGNYPTPMSERDGQAPDCLTNTPLTIPRPIEFSKT